MKNSAKITPYDCDTTCGMVLDDEFIYENVVEYLNKTKIDKKYLPIMIDHLNYVYFKNSTSKYGSIDYICWTDKKGKEILKIYNRYKGLINCYYTFEIFTV